MAVTPGVTVTGSASALATSGSKDAGTVVAAAMSGSRVVGARVAAETYVTTATTTVVPPCAITAVDRRSRNRPMVREFATIGTNQVA